MAEISQSRAIGLRVLEERTWDSGSVLRSLLMEAPHALEPGLCIIDAVLQPTDSCRFDLLALDPSRRLVLVETAVEDAGSLLLRALDHYRWTADHLDVVGRLHRQHRVDAHRSPRLLVAMPEIPSELAARCAMLAGIDVTLVAVHYLEAEGVRGLWGRRVALPPPPVAADAGPDHPLVATLTDEELHTLLDPLTAS